MTIVDKPDDTYTETYDAERHVFTDPRLQLAYDLGRAHEQVRELREMVQRVKARGDT